MKENERGKRKGKRGVKKKKKKKKKGVGGKSDIQELQKKKQHNKEKGKVLFSLFFKNNCCVTGSSWKIDRMRQRNKSKRRNYFEENKLEIKTKKEISRKEKQ